MAQAGSGAARPKVLGALSQICRSFGHDPELVLGAAGNASAKLGDLLWVSASGIALRTIEENDFVALDGMALGPLLGAERPRRATEGEALELELLAARVEPRKDQRPSFESLLHYLAPGTFAVHLHPTLVNEFACSEQGRPTLEAEVPGQLAWVEVAEPGLPLAQALQRSLEGYRRQHGQARPRAVIMQNHGALLAGDVPGEVEADLAWLLGALGELKARLSGRSADEGTPALAPEREAALVNVLGPSLRGLLSEAGQPLPIVTFDGTAVARAFGGRPDGRQLAMGGPLTSDHVAYCGSFPLWFDPEADEPPGAMVARLSAAVNEHRRRYSRAPAVVVVPGLGLFAAGGSWAEADLARDAYLEAIRIMVAALPMGGPRRLPEDVRTSVERHQEARRAARGSSPAGRAAGKVVLVTGAAQGFGLEIAQDLAAQGGHVALA
ncbi:MAG TPA: class II aldolase/adducin family protein, partial [Acidimicrobiales bacterium]|nr:class II aldolase/adducin family protein [Acidimicrobiales bacterium]